MGPPDAQPPQNGHGGKVPAGASQRCDLDVVGGGGQAMEEATDRSRDLRGMTSVGSGI
jgi:hypothetical protein